MNLRLVYYYYAVKGDFPLIYKYHLVCLKKYNKIFDEVLIVIAVDDENDLEYINSLKIKFLQIFDSCKNISFKIYKNNTYYREAIAFKQEIIDTLPQSDTLTFFGHSKGFTNEFTEQLKKWVCAMYYFSLRDPDKVKHDLMVELSIFYGYMVMRGSEISSKYNWHFPGSFYWINCPYLHMEKGDSIPKMSNRWYVEMLPGSIYKLSSTKYEFHKARWPGKYFLEGNYNCYVEFTYLLKLVFSEEDIEKFNKFVEEIDKEVEIFHF